MHRPRFKESGMALWLCLSRCVALLLLVAVCLADSVFAQQDVPRLTGRVVDLGDILSQRTEDELANLLNRHEAETSNQVVVLTIPSLDGEAIEDYSLRVARAWELGQAEKNNGVLLTVAVEDRKMRIEVGYGLEGPLPDAVASRIIRNELTPRFRKGDFDGGVTKGVEAILGAIDGTYTPEASGSDDFDDMPILFRLLFGGMFLFIPLFIAFFMVLVGPLALRIFMFFFTLPFVTVGSLVLLGKWGLILIALYIVGYIGFNIYLSRHPKWKAAREAYKEAAKTGDSVDVELFGRTITISTASSSGGSSGGGWSSGGGGFSGGGGSFGGGGASGGW